VILYGTRVRESPEDLNEREIRKEIRSAIPTLFEGFYSYCLSIARLNRFTRRFHFRFRLNDLSDR
jgi:hypothetical protein